MAKLDDMSVQEQRLARRADRSKKWRELSDAYLAWNEQMVRSCKYSRRQLQELRVTKRQEMKDAYRAWSDADLKQHAIDSGPHIPRILKITSPVQ